jgi:hypothetical protein
MNERFKAAAQKRNKDLKIKEDLRAVKETKEATFSPIRNLKSLRITSKKKESFGESIFRLSSTPSDKTVRRTTTSGYIYMYMNIYINKI